MTKKVVVSVRISEDTVHSFDKKIEETFGSTRGHKPEVIEELMKTYIEGDHQQAILEETLKQVETSQQQLKDTQQRNQYLQQELEDYKNKYNDIHQRLEKKEEQEEQTRQRYEEDKDKLKTEINEWKENATKYENKYEHEKAVRDKLNDEHNQLLHKQEKYSYVFGAVTNMAWWKRLLGIYPEEIKELQPAEEKQEDFTQQE